MHPTKIIARTFQHEGGPVTLCVELDPSQIFPDDPGQGTPQLVAARRGGMQGRIIETATLNCALCEGELGCGDFILTPEMSRWLEARETEIARFWASQPLRP